MITSWRTGVRRRPLVAFHIGALGLGLPVAALPALVEHGLLAAPAPPLPVVVLVLTHGVLLPCALAVTAVTEGRDGVRRLVARAARWRIGVGPWLVALVAVPAGAVLLGAAAGGGLTVDLPGIAAATVSSLVALVLIHLVEELVWAGVVQTRLAHRMGPRRAAVLTAVPFAAVHAPLLLVGPVSPASVLADAAGLLLLAVVLRLLVGAVLVRAGGSVLAAAAVHAVFNATNNSGGVVDRLLTDVDQGLLAPAAAVLVTAGLDLADRIRRTAPPDPGLREGPAVPDPTTPKRRTPCAS